MFSSSYCPFRYKVPTLYILFDKLNYIWKDIMTIIIHQIDPQLLRWKKHSAQI